MSAREFIASLRAAHVSAAMLLAALGCVPVEAQTTAEWMAICQAESETAAARIAAVAQQCAWRSVEQGVIAPSGGNGHALMCITQTQYIYG